MKVKDLKAELVNAPDGAEVVVMLDMQDLKNLKKLGAGSWTPGTGLMVTDPEGKDAGVMIVGSEDSRPLEVVFIIKVKNAARKAL